MDTRATHARIGVYSRHGEVQPSGLTRLARVSCDARPVTGEGAGSVEASDSLGRLGERTSALMSWDNDPYFARRALMISYDDHQLAARLESYLCCRVTVWSTMPSRCLRSQT